MIINIILVLLLFTVVGLCSWIRIFTNKLNAYSVISMRHTQQIRQLQEEHCRQILEEENCMKGTIELSTEDGRTANLKAKFTKDK